MLLHLYALGYCTQGHVGVYVVHVPNDYSRRVFPAPNVMHMVVTCCVDCRL